MVIEGILELVVAFKKLKIIENAENVFIIGSNSKR
jgi:hypothetical protein